LEMYRDVMVCTVGASLLSNFQRRDDLPSLGSKEALRWMLEQDPEQERALGAEINSIASMVSLEILDRRNTLIFLVSDTQDGETIGNVLKSFFEEHPSIGFERIEVKKIEDLDDSRIHDFKTKGLRNLVRELGNYIKEYGNRLVINATGGFKAQIAFALALGQAVGVPVYYRFERFPQVIELPPLPLSLDAQLWEENMDIFQALSLFGEMEEEEFEKITEGTFTQLDPRIKMLLDKEHIEGKYYISLNPMGEVFAQAMGISNIDLSEVELKESDVPLDKRFIFRQPEHSEQFIIKYRALIEKIYSQPFVRKVIVTGFSQHFDRTVAVFKKRGEEIHGTIGAKGGTLRVLMETTASNDLERRAAVWQLNQLSTRRKG